MEKLEIEEPEEEQKGDHSKLEENDLLLIQLYTMHNEAS